jgi:phosphomannomutase/phosphoglucomutase
LIEILAKRRKPLSALVADLPNTVVTPEIRVDMPDAVKFEVVQRIRARFERYLAAKQGLGPSKLLLRDVVTIDGVRAVFEQGWGLIRASNTQPALVLRFEAVSAEHMALIRSIIEAELAQAQVT